MRVNVPIALLSVVLSLTLWLVVYGQNLPQPKTFTITHVSDTLSENPRQRDHWYVFPVSSLNINVEATSDKLDEVAPDIKNVEAIIDLDHPVEGTQRYPFQLSSDMISRLMTDKHPTVTVTVEKMTEKDKVPVKVTQLGELSNSDWRLDSYTLSRKDVVVRGPRSLVLKVAHVRADLQLDDIKEPTDEAQIAPLSAISAGGEVITNLRISPAFVSITPIVTAAPKEKKVVVAPIFIGQPAEGFLQKGYDSLKPQEVTLTGPPNVLSGLTGVETLPIDVSGTIAPKTFKARLNLPLGTSCAHRTVSVRFLVQPDPNYRKPLFSSQPSTNTQAPPNNPGGATTAGPTGTTTGHQ